MKLRVMLADDHEMIREGLRLLVNSQADMETVGEAENGRKAVALAQELRPDVIVMDVSMPELNGLEATKRLRTLCPDSKILSLTRHTERAYLQQLLEAGASGYLLKQSASQELLRAIRAVAAGQKYLDPAMTEHLVENVVSRRTARGAPANTDLSKREQEVLRLIAWGYSNKEIAARLELSVKTVEAHKANAMRRLNMHSRIDIVRYALLQGWLREQ
ncbi:MAG: response regulator transcription factor [Acidobacteriota bacterium]|nr:response regulator transcription factor [Acidobacteriota bacterium]